MKIEEGGYYLLKNGNVMHVKHLVQNLAVGEFYNKKGKFTGFCRQDITRIDCVFRVKPKQSIKPLPIFSKIWT